MPQLFFRRPNFLCENAAYLSHKSHKALTTTYIILRNFAIQYGRYLLRLLTSGEAFKNYFPASLSANIETSYKFAILIPTLYTALICHIT